VEDPPLAVLSEAEPVGLAPVPLFALSFPPVLPDRAPDAAPDPLAPDWPVAPLAPDCPAAPPLAPWSEPLVVADPPWLPLSDVFAFSLEQPRPRARTAIAKQ
jgi:hypothetical protein